LNEASTGAISWLDEQLDHLRGKLDKSELALHEYKREKKILSVSADDQSEMLRAKMAQLTQALTSAETSRARIGARRGELRKIEGNDPAVLPAEELMSSDVLRALREKYILAYEAAESLRAEGKGESHPAVASAVARREAAQQLLLAEVANIKSSVEKDYAAISEEIGSLSALYEAAKEQALELNLLAIEYKRLERARNTNQELFDLVTSKSKETGLTSHLRPSNVRLVDRPEIPGAPFSPNKPLNLLAGALGGLLLGLGFALGREQLDSTLRRPEMMEEVFSFPFLGILPAIKSASRRTPRREQERAVVPAAGNRSELSAHHEPTGSMAEAARTVRTNLLLGRGVSAETKVFLATSAAPGDGKTTVACSLAISLAQTGERVALVDCDLRRPRLHRIFDKPNHSGVTSVLAGTLSTSEVAHQTVVPNLTFISSGIPPMNPAELLHSEGFAAFLRDLRSSYDRVVLDSPPLIPVADAAILATQADATVVVARAFETKKHAARRAAKILLDVNANVIGTVLNAVDFSRGEYRYYQYYDYGRQKPARSAFPPKS
jgi:capsular exopolysaccharide synthesis family protein